MGASERFDRYIDHLSAGLGHLDRHAGLKGYCTGLMLPLSRKSVEPMAARVDPMTGIVAAKVVSKAIAKGTLMVAAKTVGKVAASKAASSLVGAAAGAAIGSVVPLIGTAFGGVAGFVIGLASGVGVDAGLLLLEEQLSRAEFRKQILASIAEARNEFRAKVFVRQ